MLMFSLFSCEFNTNSTRILHFLASLFKDLLASIKCLPSGQLLAINANTFSVFTQSISSSKSKSLTLKRILNNSVKNLGLVFPTPTQTFSSCWTTFFDKQMATLTTCSLCSFTIVLLPRKLDRRPTAATLRNILTEEEKEETDS